MKNLVLVTGATGFVGQSVAHGLLRARHAVVAVARQVPPAFSQGFNRLTWQSIAPIDSHTPWQNVLLNINTVVHCAARSHVMADPGANGLSHYRDVNVYGTLHLARQAAAAGVRRFVFLSSIKVSGENTQLGRPFSETNDMAPQDAYAQSKAEAEQGLLSVAKETGMELVIIRPPLVVGPGVKGNFANMLQWVQRGIPLPFGAVHNQRSLVALDNLVSLVLLCADRNKSPQAVNQVFVVADGEDISTTTLLRKISKAAGCPSRLIPVPHSLLRIGAIVLGKRTVADRLLGNLQIDTTKARTLLGWRPVVTLDQQLSGMFEREK